MIYFQHLDLLRFLASFSVLLLHAYEGWKDWFKEIEFPFLNEYFQQLFKNLGIGVDVFFLISGFLITYILLEEKRKYKSINIKNFMIRRAFRIWPLYFFLIIISPLLVYLTNSESPNYLANLFFLGNFDIIFSGKWMYPFSHFWSICIEEHFYLIWPFIIAFVPVKYLLKTFVFLILISISFRCFAYLNFDNFWYHIYLNPLSRMDEIIIGAIGGYFYFSKPIVFKLPKLLRVLFLISLIVILSVESMVLWDGLISASLKKYIYLVLIIPLLLDFNFNPSFKRVLKPNSVFHYLGKVSFGIYMYSNVILLFVIGLFKYAGLHNITLFFLVNVLVTIVVSVISYEFFEKKFLKLSSKYRS